MEDFIPYELEIKLKEKGFEVQGGFQYLYYNEELVKVHDYCNISPYKYAPTISQVLKWLREKKIYIMIDRSFSVKNSWHYIICNNDDFENLIQQESIPNRKWELAALAGIEYVIDNIL